MPYQACSCSSWFEGRPLPSLLYPPTCLPSGMTQLVLFIAVVLYHLSNPALCSHPHYQSVSVWWLVCFITCPASFLAPMSPHGSMGVKGCLCGHKYCSMLGPLKYYQIV